MTIVCCSGWWLDKLAELGTMFSNLRSRHCHSHQNMLKSRTFLWGRPLRRRRHTSVWMWRRTLHDRRSYHRSANYRPTRAHYARRWEAFMVLEINSRVFFFIVTVCGLWLLQTLSVCVCVCLYVNLSRFYGLYLAYYESDFDQTWWKCWNFGLINCFKIS